MECDVCRTLAQQLRSYEMEVQDASDGSLPDGASACAGSLLANVLEEASKTRVLYQHHRERFHKSPHSNPAIQPNSSAALPGGLLMKAEQLVHATPSWPDDLSELSNQAVLDYRAENRAWNKRLRQGTVELVNTRLAKTITKEEYTLSRDRTNQDAAECFRRASMLVRDMEIRERGVARFNGPSDLRN